MPVPDPTFNNDQYAALLQMDDLGGLEKKMAQQNALATTLRGQALQPSAGKDWASQLSRGLQGGMAGLAAKQQATGLDAYGAAKKKNLGTALGYLGKKQAMPNVVDPAMTNEDLTGFQ